MQATTTAPQTVYTNGAVKDEAIIKIVENDIGLAISGSRTTVYDVMDAYDEGYSPAAISEIFNLSPHQVEVALAYIEEHRARLEPILKRILEAAAENERYHRALVAEIEKQRPTQMTPQRIALNALIEKSRRKWGEIDASDFE